MTFATLVLLSVLSAPARADDAPAQPSPSPLASGPATTTEETSITIRKGPQPSPSPSATGAPEYQIVVGDAEIAGDPHAGSQESLASWKEACADWKKETKELNKENQILAISCGSPQSRLLENGQRQHHSSGTYKVKVRMK